ncbi:MAG: GGDEF domain-containing protein [Granulosicoccus sp.]|nr:GGDEF domain-containing protein [Granulosicoccus sp.]
MSVLSAKQAPITSHSALRQQRLDVQLRQLEFSALLHRKLDLEKLFECLLIEGQAFVQFDGLQFLAGERGADIVLGSSRQHRQRFELRLGERLLGEVVLMRTRKFKSRDERDAERLVESLVYPLDNALEHHMASVKAMTDVSTGLRNQRAMEDQLPREIRSVRRTEQPLSMMLISVDYLESISEHHGFEVGEQAWQSVAETLTSRLRQSDLIFKTDVDSFCIVLTQTGMDGSLILAERLLAAVDRCVSYDNVQFVLTASAGVTELGAADDADTLFERVNSALVLARQSGRNQVKAIAPEQPHGSDDPDAA